MHLECLEPRIALSTVMTKFAPALVHPLGTNQSTAARHHSAHAPRGAELPSTQYSSTDVTPNGDVIVSATDGASSQEFQKVSAGWKMIAWNQYELPGLFQPEPVFVEDDWAPEGALTENIWNLWGHGAPGSTSQYAQLIVQQSQITLTLYHAAGYPIYFGVQTANSQDATVTWTFDRAKGGGVGAMLQYHVDDRDTSWSADWINQSVYHDSNYYGSGWLEWYPNHNSISVPSPFNKGLMTHVNQAAVQAQTGNAPIPIPPGVSLQQQTLNGHPAMTYWNSPHTNSVTFVYQGQAKKTLIGQIYGRPVDGKWVTTTDHSKAFISQTATFDKLGGNIQTSVTTLTPANGQTATLNGTWTSGTAVDNATGIETGANYLNFGSVTIQYQNGKPVTRYGVLQQDQGGYYATDTFNSSGTSVVQRDVANAKGGPTTQTWTGSGDNLAISWNNPDPSTSIEVTTQQLNAPHSGYTGYTMLTFRVALVKPLDFVFNNGTDVMMTTYNWRAFASYDRGNDDWNWNYREKAQTGREHLAQSDPSAQLPFSSTPFLDKYWNNL
jgi:hypothetical protein